MREELEKIIKEVVIQHATENNLVGLKDPTLETVLFGKDSVIDSIGLVTIIVEVESRIFDNFNITVSLTDEKALSQKNSPFKTIGSLTNYIDASINKSV